ncbi:MAG: tRNA (adenosine(37)-N6)-threonylcarbamoyltransferase complex dimerization subunit type 1 TsaB [Nitrospirales bacterium]|nr:tRNA (adenosine(37)-N6)-threonylcarbamoyltransferase complex dimerization subunit type 1 TsaB [Nitrospira sp.]MDR4502962.1 tRNA (adenosine(37)-N6)-threonylcarbamoyltransferase complex dimerization subunit type 1 TsaB [Nitrospirales bacterium]
MLILAIETATSRHSIAVLEDSSVLGYRHGDSRGSHTRWLIPKIDELLRSLDLSMRKFSGLAVSIGPGSFTGLRAGLATVAGFRTALDIPIVIVPTLEALAWNIPSETRLICPMLQATAQEVYWAGFRWERGILKRVTDDHVSQAEQVIEFFKEPVVGFGEGWLIHRHIIVEKSPVWTSASADVHEASAVSVALASLPRFARGEYAQVGVTPRYVLPSYAEAKRRVS